jgi:hypothetical protein
MYRDAIAAGPGERISDLSEVLEPVRKPLFVDTAHLNEAGNRLMAEALVPILLRARADARAAHPSR